MSDNPEVICSKKEGNLCFELTHCTHICRYHKYPKRRKYTDKQFAPRGMCIDLFHSAYPVCLAILYGADLKSRVTVSCPNPDSNSAVELLKIPVKTIKLRKLILKILSKFGMEIELPLYSILMRIVENDSGSCHYAYKAGKTFKFNTWLGREVCPASFDAMYPTIHNILRGRNAPWKEEDKEIEIVCPDSKSNITMRIHE